jgi:hypothetical protein
MITINMDKAREIWKQKISEEANNQIQKLNELYHVYIDEGKDPAPVIERRKKLRSLTEHPSITNAKTPEELKAFWPEELTTVISYPLTPLKSKKTNK